MKKLPITSLEETQENFLATVKTLLSKDEFESSQKKAHNFFSRPALELQKLLEEENEQSSTSWLYKYWLDMYLQTKNAVNIDANFCVDLKLPKKIKALSNEQVLDYFASSLACVCKSFIKGDFETPKDGRGNEICLNQFNILRGASRIPKKGKDIYSISNEEVNFASVLYKNVLYKIELFDDDTNFSLENAFKNIIEHTQDQNALLPCISFLPTDEAGVLRDELYLTNQFFDIVENSLFNISIIDESFSSEEEKRLYMLYLNGENSWLFKPLNFIYNLQDKELFINADHSFEDAGTIIEIIKRSFETAPTTKLDAQEVLIKEHLDAKNKAKILALKEDYLKGSNAFRCSFVQLDVSDEQCLGISKDAFMQIILLYAHFKTYKELKSVYEAVDMREFAYGRTECVRPLSEQMLSFVKALDENTDKEALLKLLDSANVEHKNRIKNAKKAKGVDRHLFGLKSMLEKLASPQEAKEFFEDVAYKKLSQNFISTTCVGSLEFMGYVIFSPVVWEGLGISYVKTKEKIVYVISYHEDSQKDVNEFVRHLNVASSKLKALL